MDRAATAGVSSPQVSNYIRAPNATYDPTAEKSLSKEQVLRKQGQRAADVMRLHKAFIWKLREANLYIDMPRYNILKVPLVNLVLLEFVELMLSYDRFVRDVEYFGVTAEDKSEYDFTETCLGEELRIEDAGRQNLISKVRDKLEDILVPYIQPRAMPRWLTWLPFSRP